MVRSKTAEVFQRDDGFNFGDGAVVLAGGVWCGGLDVGVADDSDCCGAVLVVICRLYKEANIILVCAVLG